MVPAGGGRTNPLTHCHAQYCQEEVSKATAYRSHGRWCQHERAAEFRERDKQHRQEERAEAEEAQQQQQAQQPAPRLQSPLQHQQAPQRHDDDDDNDEVAAAGGMLQARLEAAAAGNDVLQSPTAAALPAISTSTANDSLQAVTGAEVAGTEADGQQAAHPSMEVDGRCGWDGL